MSRGCTRDAALDGRVTLWQHRRGYRFSVDAVLLGVFCRPARGGLGADLGTGCGVVGLVLLARGAARRVVGVELQADLARLARRNARENRDQGTLSVVRADLRRRPLPLAAGCFDLVVSNPPFFRLASGRRSPDPERAVARDERALPLADLLRAARWLLRTGGRFGVVYPAPRLAELLTGARDVGLEPKRLRLVHPKIGLVQRLAACRRPTRRGCTPRAAARDLW